MISMMLSILATPRQEATVDLARLRQRIDAVWPQPDEEKWLQVGWELDLFAARQRSVDENKPIFLWMMNGHPMGCT
jgi:hypothetical protein